MTNIQNPSSKNTYLESWLSKNFSPCGIVYSTPSVQQIMLKNNLTPSEFLRPLGDFSHFNPISFSHEGGYSKTIYDFKIDFYDATSYSKIPKNEIEPILTTCINATPTLPKWKINNKHITKTNITPITKNLIFHSFPWFNEYESTLIECLRFNETEIYQQPFMNVYIISSKDSLVCIDEIKALQKPSLLSKCIYVEPFLNIGIILHDYSDNCTSITTSKADSIMKAFQQRYNYIKFGFFNVNTKSESAVLTYSFNDDIWFSYLHKIDLYKPSNVDLLKNISNANYLRGRYISLKEINDIQSFLYNTLNVHLKNDLNNKINELLKKVNGGKGIKGLFNKKKKDTKISRAINQKLTDTEKEMYVLSILLFFIRDYKGSFRIIKKFYTENIQGKLSQYDKNVLQYYIMLQFLKTKKIKKININHPSEEYFKLYLCDDDYIYFYLRSILISIRMQESMYDYSNCMKTLEQTVQDVITTSKHEYLLFNEKLCLYYLFIHPLQIRKFTLNLIKAVLNVNISKYNFGLYSRVLFDIGLFYNILLHSDKDKYSFNTLKIYLNKYMSNVCNYFKYKEGSLFFCQNTLELIKYQKHEQQNKNVIESILNHLVPLFVENSQITPQLTHCKLVEIDNSSLLVIEKQDYEIGQCIINKARNNNKFSCFNKYSKESIRNKYAQLNENDLKALYFVDAITSKKQISNFYIKRHYIINKGDTVYIRFTMKNPYNTDLVLSNIKLIIDTNNINNNIIQYDEKDITLLPHSESSIDFKVNIIDKGAFTIKGLEMKLSSMFTLIHSFAYTKNNTLYNYRMKKTSKNKSIVSSQLKSSNELSQHKKQKDNFSFKVSDNNEHINISFPLGKDITLYQYQLYYHPVQIENKSNINITSLTLFVNDNNENILLCEYIKKDINLPFNTNTILHIPFLPMNFGMFYIKVIIKFTSNSRLNEIELKRFVFKLNIIYSVIFNMNIQVKEYNILMKKMLFDIIVNCYIRNYKQLTSVNCNDIVYNTSKWKLLSCSDWNATNDDVDVCTKCCNTLSIVCDMKQTHNKKVFNYNNIIKDDNYDNSFNKVVNNLLSKGNCIVIPFSVKDIEHNAIKCIYYKSIDIKEPVMDEATYFKQLIKNVITITAVKDDQMENYYETYITLNVTINKIESLNGVVHSIIVQPILTDNNFEWIGLYTWECIYDVLTNTNTPYKEEFIFSTLHKGILNVNKLQFTLHTQFGTFNIGTIGDAICIHI